MQATRMQPIDVCLHIGPIRALDSLGVETFTVILQILQKHSLLGKFCQQTEFKNVNFQYGGCFSPKICFMRPLGVIFEKKFSSQYNIHSLYTNCNTVCEFPAHLVLYLKTMCVLAGSSRLPYGGFTLALLGITLIYDPNFFKLCMAVIKGLIVKCVIGLLGLQTQYNSSFPKRI